LNNLHTEYIKMAVNSSRFNLLDGENIQQPTDSVSSRDVINLSPEFNKIIKTSSEDLEKGVDNIIGRSSTDSVKKSVGAVATGIGIPMDSATRDKVGAVVGAIDSNGTIDTIFRGISNVAGSARQLGSNCLNDLLKGLKCSNGGISNGKKYLNKNGCSLEALQAMILGMGGSTGSLFDPCAATALLKGVSSKAANSGLSGVFTSLSKSFDPTTVISSGAGLIKDAVKDKDFELFEDIGNSGFGKEVASVSKDVVSGISNTFSPQTLRNSPFEDLTSTLSKYDDKWDTNGGMMSTAKTGSGSEDFLNIFKNQSATDRFSISADTANTATSTGTGNYLAGLVNTSQSANFL
jgi:hypothetical protein